MSIFLYFFLNNMGKTKKDKSVEQKLKAQYDAIQAAKNEVKANYERYTIPLVELTLDYPNPDQRRVVEKGVNNLVESFEKSGVQSETHPISVVLKSYEIDEELPPSLGTKYCNVPPDPERSAYLIVNGQHRIRALMKFDPNWKDRCWEANVYIEPEVKKQHPQYMSWLCENLEITQGISTSVTDKVIALRAKGYQFCIGDELVEYMLAYSAAKETKSVTVLQSRMRCLATFPVKGTIPRDTDTCLQSTCTPEQFSTIKAMFENYLTSIGPSLTLEYGRTFSVLVESSYPYAHFSLNQMIDIIKLEWADSTAKQPSFNPLHKLFEFLPRYLAHGFSESNSNLLDALLTKAGADDLRSKVKADLLYSVAGSRVPSSLLKLFESLEKTHFEELRGLVKEMNERKLSKSIPFEKHLEAFVFVRKWFRNLDTTPALPDSATVPDVFDVELNNKVVCTMKRFNVDFFRWASESQSQDKYPFVFGDVPYFVTDKSCDSIEVCMQMFPAAERTNRNFIEKVLTALKKITKKDAQIFLYCSREQQTLFVELCQENDDFTAYEIFVNMTRSTLKSQLARTHNCTNVLEFAVQLIRGSPKWTTWGTTYDPKTKTAQPVKMMSNLFESTNRPSSTDLRPFPKDETLNGRLIDFFACPDPKKHTILDIFAGGCSMIVPAALAGYNVDMVEIDVSQMNSFKNKCREANLKVGEQQDLNDQNLRHNRVKSREQLQADKTAAVLKRKRQQDAQEESGVDTQDTQARQDAQEESGVDTQAPQDAQGESEEDAQGESEEDAQDTHDTQAPQENTQKDPQEESVEDAQDTQALTQDTQARQKDPNPSSSSRIRKYAKGTSLMTMPTNDNSGSKTSKRSKKK